MKKCFVFLVCCLFTGSLVSAANKYWVGPLNSNWNNPVNWSLTSGGPGGASVPGLADAVIFTGTAKLKVDISPIIASLSTTTGASNVVLYATVPTTITILSNLLVAPFSSLKDSTATNVPFNVYFKYGSTGSILGDWTFEGGVPLSGPGDPGASFTAPVGTLVTVGYVPFFAPSAGRIICKINSKPIVSTNATLRFNYYTYFISDSKPLATIPFATWAKDSVRAIDPYSGVLGAPASTISLTGTFLQVQHLGGIPVYGRVLVDAPALVNDVSLALPDGSKIKGNLDIRNTNGRILTLLAPVSSSSSVQVELGTNEAGFGFGGYLMMSGNTKVTLARATVAAPATSYRLLVNKSFNQSGGNFSLQDYDFATGATTLDIRNDLIETAGTFFTNSNSTSASAKFRVVMNDPYFITGPSGLFESSRIIRMSSGTIDNGHNMVILRIDHSVYSIPLALTSLNGVLLQSPLKVGRLELVRGPLTTTTSYMLTVTDPNPASITVSTNNSYVNGPLRRFTNSIQPYVFPTGKGNTAAGGYVFDSCIVIPVSNTTSMYQAEYFKTGFPALAVTPPLQGVSPVEYWTVMRILGSDARLRLILNAAVPGSTALKGIVVARYVGVSWITENGTVKTPGNSALGFVTSRPLSIFNNFTFGYGIPTSFPTGLLVGQLATSSIPNGPIEGKVGNPASNSSDNLFKNGKDNREPTAYPNPFIENFSIDFYYEGSKTARASVDMYDLKGRVLHKQSIDKLSPGYNHITVNLTGKKLPAAVYSVQLSIDGVPAKTVKMIKAE